MKFSALQYYISSIPTIVTQMSFWKIPLVFIRKQVLIQVNNNMRFYIEDLLDAWIIKEVILDDQYRAKNKVKGKIVIDIGAGLGDFSIFISEKAKHVFAFEVNSKRAILTKKNIKLNKCKNISLIVKQATSLDDILIKNNISQCGFIKIDCEGCEYLLFNNCSQKTLTTIQMIAMEVHVWSKKDKQRLNKLKSKLRENGFSIIEEPNPVHESLSLLFAERKKNVSTRSFGK